MKVTFVEPTTHDRRTVPRWEDGCVAIELDGRQAGFLIRDLPKDRGGRWFCTAWPTCPEARQLQAAGLHDTELSRDLSRAQAAIRRTMTAHAPAEQPPLDVQGRRK